MSASKKAKTTKPRVSKKTTKKENLDSSVPILIHNFNPGSSIAYLSFKDFLDSKQVSKSKQDELRNADNYIKDLLWQTGIGDKALAGTAISDLVTNKNIYEVMLEPKTAKLLQANSIKFMVSGKDVKPVLVSSTTHRIKEIPNIKQVSNLSSITFGIIAVAHIVSNYDMAKSIKILGQKVDKIIAYRVIEQYARLEACYYHTQQMLLLDPLLIQTQLLMVHRDLLHLRFSWLREIAHDLMQINDTQSFLNKLGFLRNNYDRKITASISEIEERLLLMVASIRLDSFITRACLLSGNADNEMNTLFLIQNILDRKYMKYYKQGNMVATKSKVDNLINNVLKESKYLYPQQLTDLVGK